MSAEYLPDFEPMVFDNILEDSHFVYAHAWLRDLAEQYRDREEKATSLGDKDQLIQIAIISGSIRTAWHRAKKTYAAMSQYRVLCRRVLETETRLYRIKQQRRFGLYFSEWNKYQVYRDMSEMYGQVMANCRGEMEQTCNVVDKINEQFLARYEHSSDSE